VLTQSPIRKQSGIGWMAILNQQCHSTQCSLRQISLLLLHYIHLTAFFQDNWRKPAPKTLIILDFTRAKDDGVAVASAATIYKSFVLRSKQITMPIHHQRFFTDKYYYIYTKQWYRDGAAHTAEENSYVCSLIQMRLLPSARVCGQ